MSYATAKLALQRRRRLSAQLDKIGEHGAALLGLCGHGGKHSWSVLIADAFFVNCACCLFWRGFAVGLLTAAIAWGLGFAILALL